VNNTSTQKKPKRPEDAPKRPEYTFRGLKNNNRGIVNNKYCLKTNIKVPVNNKKGQNTDLEG